MAVRNVLNHDNNESSPKILSTSEAFGHLRKELIENMGVKRTRGFLFRYGYRLGESDAEEVKKVNDSTEYLISQASVLHLGTGHVKNMKSERTIEKDDDGNIVSFYAKGRWYDSFEALEHIKHHGLSTEPVCHTLTGYASGYMSVVCNRDVIVKEISCVGKGDPECTYELRLAEHWGDEIGEVLSYQQEQRIVDELQYTYEQLLEERNYMEKVSMFHRKLTESISNGNDLHEIASITYEYLNIPVIIEDLSFQGITYAGISQDEYTTFIQELSEHVLIKNKTSERLPKFKTTEEIQTPNQTFLLSPIYVQRKIIGYCIFVYPKCDHVCQNDVMFIERAANAASLILLNQKTSLEALEKIKGNFFEQIINGEFKSEEDIFNRGKYMGYNFSEVYSLLAIEITQSRNNELNKLIEKMTETISGFLDIQGHKGLLANHNQHIVLLLPRENYSKKERIHWIESLDSHLMKTYKGVSLKYGLSDASDAIVKAPDRLKEAYIALRLSNKQKITFFEDLGILGVLINTENEEAIKEIAKKELGPLMEENETKSIELLRTLYVFLSYGGNLQQTMDKLSLSMSGLTYRKNKIEKLINKDLRDPSESYHLLLILNALIVLNEIDLEL